MHELENAFLFRRAIFRVKTLQDVITTKNGVLILMIRRRVLREIQVKRRENVGKTRCFNYLPELRCRPNETEVKKSKKQGGKHQPTPTRR